jgi:NADH-quinone oxidoreductase subunit K
MYYNIIPFVLFIIGLLGVLTSRKNILLIIMSIEVILLSVNLNFILFSLYLGDIIGQMFCFYILTIAASESAIGLALLVAYNQNYLNFSNE